MAYQQDIGDNHNSLALYGHYLSNLGMDQSLAELVTEIIQIKSPCRILDLGCGDGGALKELKEKFGEQIQTLGIDRFPVPFPPDQIFLADAAEMDWPADCDLVVSFRALHEIGRIEFMLRKVAAALAPGGTAILSIRTQYENRGVIQPLGKIHEEDLAFLRRFEEQTQWRGRQVLVTAFTAEARATGNPGEFVAGYLVLIHNNA